MALFRNESEAREATVRIAPMPDGKYRLRSVMSGKALGVVTRDEWARGVRVELPEKVEIVEVERVS